MFDHATMLVLAQFLPAFYLHVPWMCLALSLVAAASVSLPRHKWRIRRLLLAIFTSSVVGAVIGFGATYATGKYCIPSAGGNNAQGGILVFLVMVVVTPFTAFVVASSFPTAKSKPQIKEPTTKEAKRKL
jgi:hypothetical protein